MRARRSCRSRTVLLLAACVIAACAPSELPQAATTTVPPEPAGGSSPAAVNDHARQEAVVWPATEYGPVEPGTVSSRPATAVDEFGDGPSAIVVVGAEDGPIAPGTVVELGYPAAAPRGITHTLIRRTDRSWQLAFQLGASEVPAVPSGAWALPGEDVTGPDIMLTGTGPLFVRVPPPTPPGTYRICHTVGRCSDPFEIADS